MSQSQWLRPPPQTRFLPASACPFLLLKALCLQWAVLVCCTGGQHRFGSEWMQTAFPVCLLRVRSKRIMLKGEETDQICLTNKSNLLLYMYRKFVPYTHTPLTNPNLAILFGINLCMHDVPRCFSCVWLFVAPWTVAHQAPPSLRFSRQESWGGLPCPLPGDLPDLRIEPRSLMSPALAGGFFPPVLSPGKPNLRIFYYNMYFPSILKGLASFSCLWVPSELQPGSCCLSPCMNMIVLSCSPLSSSPKTTELLP